MMEKPIHLTAAHSRAAALASLFCFVERSRFSVKTVSPNVLAASCYECWGKQIKFKVVMRGKENVKCTFFFCYICSV